METQETIRVGVIGAGANTRRHDIPKLQAISGVEIVGVRNRRPESSQKVADEFGIPTIYDSWTEAIADPETNANCDRNLALHPLSVDSRCARSQQACDV